jgi:hypothetical protein
VTAPETAQSAAVVGVRFDGPTQIGTFVQGDPEVAAQLRQLRNELRDLIAREKGVDPQVLEPQFRNLDRSALREMLFIPLAGAWHGEGFNLVARPNFDDDANLFLALNLTRETLKFDPMLSPIQNRGSAQPSIELFGLTYQHQIVDATTGGGLHTEQGIWVTQPETTQPLLVPPKGGLLVTRLANIPHGASLLAQGIANQFAGPPTISPGPQPVSGGNPAFSAFPSFNSTPLTPIFPDSPIFAAKNSEFQSKSGGGFPQYTLTNFASAIRTRTPFGDIPAIPLSPNITQDLINDPIILLQQTIQRQIAEGYVFDGIVFNFATASPITFNTQPILSPTSHPSPATAVSLPQCQGGIQNTSFLQTNAEVALVYTTFWLEKLTHPDRPSFVQLQYAQMVLLNFPAIAIPGQPVFSWPHVSVATLRKTLD